jgi:hypothetical protein
MQHPTSTVPALILNTPFAGSRVAYLPVDIDRCFGQDNLPDHAQLLANLVRWAANGHIELEVKGPGLIDCQLYRQAGHLILHLVNLTNAGTWRPSLYELTTVGPLTVRVRLPEGVAVDMVQLLVAEKTVEMTLEDGWVAFEIASVTDHEVVVVS